MTTPSFWFYELTSVACGVRADFGRMDRCWDLTSVGPPPAIRHICNCTDYGRAISASLEGWDLTAVGPIFLAHSFTALTSVVWVTTGLRSVPRSISFALTSVVFFH